MESSNFATDVYFKSFKNISVLLYVVKPIWTIADKFLGGVFTISKVPFSQI